MTPQHTRHSTGPPNKRKGNADNRREGQHNSTRPSLTMPPTIRYATPPSTMAPPSTTTRGGQTEDTPPHEQHRHALTTHTPHTRQWNSARYDSSTRQHCSGTSRVRAHATALGGTAAVHTTAIPHTEEDGHHPLIHSSTLTHSRSHA